MYQKLLFGGGALERRRGSAQAIGAFVSRDIVDGFQAITDAGVKITDKEALGNFFFKTITDAERMFKTASDAMYKRVDDALVSASGKNTKMLPVLPIQGKGGLQETLIKLRQQAALGIEEANPLTPTLSVINRKFEEAAAEYGGKLSYAQANALRSDLAGQLQALRASGQTKAAGQLSELVRVFDENPISRKFNKEWFRSSSW